MCSYTDVLRKANTFVRICMYKYSFVDKYNTLLHTYRAKRFRKIHVGLKIALTHRRICTEIHRVKQRVRCDISNNAVPVRVPNIYNNNRNECSVTRVTNIRKRRGKGGWTDY